MTHLIIRIYGALIVSLQRGEGCSKVGRGQRESETHKTTSRGAWKVWSRLDRVERACVYLHDLLNIARLNSTPPPPHTHTSPLSSPGRVREASFRKALVQAYFTVFLLTTAALLVRGVTPTRVPRRSPSSTSSSPVPNLHLVPPSPTCFHPYSAPSSLPRTAARLTTSCGSTRSSLPRSQCSTGGFAFSSRRGRLTAWRARSDVLGADLEARVCSRTYGTVARVRVYPALANTR